MRERGIGRRLASSYTVAALVFLLALMALFWRLWTPIEGARRTFGWDAQWEYWGDLQFQLDAYADGDLPLWNPYDRAGYPFHSDPQAGIFYPATWLLLGGSALSGGADYWWIAVKVVLHFWLAAFGAWVYLRRRGVHPAACYVGGFVFILSYPYLHNVFSALNWSMAWTPWVLAAIDHFTQRPTRARGALVALAAAMCTLAGAPASFWYSLLVIAPYGSWALVAGARAAGPRGSPERRAYARAAAVAGATAAGLLLAMVAVQLRATGSAVGQTVREARDLTFITESTFGVDDLVALLMPRMLGGNTYLGAGPIIWAAIALTAFLSGRRLLLAAVAVLGFACALGQTGDFLAFGASLFEPFGLFRRAHRYLYVSQLPIAILAAEGLDEVIRLEAREVARRILRGVLVWGALAVLVFGTGFAINQKATLDEQPLRDAFILTVLANVVAVWLTAMLLTRRGRWKQGLAALAVVLVAGDLWFARGSDVEKRMHSIPSTARDGELAGFDGVPLAARVYDRHYLGYRPGTRLHIRDFGGYEDDPLALSRYDALLELVKRQPRQLGHANVAWFLDADPRPLKLGAADTAAFTTVKKKDRRAKQFAPAVLWVDRARVVDGGPEQALGELVHHDPGTVAVLEKDTLRGALAAAGGGGEAPPVAGRLRELGRNRLVAEIDAPADGIVVVHEAYFPGWRAWVDGVETPIVPANVAFRGLAVGPGHHEIVMKYAPRGWLALALVSLVGTLAASLVAGVGLWRERREARA
jgi:hypothetical protein